MSGLAIASLVQSGVELHWTPSDQTFQAGLILIAVPFVLQLLACIFSYLARDGATGAAVGVLATSWLAIGLIHIAAKPGATSGTLGLLLVGAGGVLGVAAVSYRLDQAAARRDLRRGGSAVRDRGDLPAQHGRLLGARCRAAGPARDRACVYATLAFELEGQRERAVLPTFRRGRAAAAIRNGAGSDRDRLVVEPGVRETT